MPPYIAGCSALFEHTTLLEYYVSNYVSSFHSGCCNVVFQSYAMWHVRLWFGCTIWSSPQKTASFFTLNFKQWVPGYHQIRIRTPSHPFLSSNKIQVIVQFLRLLHLIKLWIQIFPLGVILFYSLGLFVLLMGPLTGFFNSIFFHQLSWAYNNRTFIAIWCNLILIACLKKKVWIK